MAFAAGDKVWATVKLGDGSTLANQEGIVRTVLPNAMYQVFVIGVVLTLSESVLTGRN